MQTPFQYERWFLKILALARLFESLVRVSRRVEAPHFRGQLFEKSLRGGGFAVSVFDAEECPPPVSPAHHDQSPGPAVVARAVEFPVARDNAAGVALTQK